MAQSTRWVFTLNNYAEADVVFLTQLAETDAVRYLVVGREIAESGTPHLQGFVIFTTNHRLRAARLAISNRAHLEVARGTSAQAATYCKKEGNFEEFGQIPDGTGQGKRNDFEEFKTWVLEQPTKPTAGQVAQNYASLFIKYGRIMEWVDRVYPPPVLVTGEPRPWQQRLEETLIQDADDRKVIFVVDPIGGCGKSWFVRWFVSGNGELTQCLSVGKRDDLAYAIDESKRVFLFDVPRSQSEYLQYSVLEQLKNRMIFSPKYGSRTKILSHNAHVVVFMNEEPKDCMTADRYEIIRLRNI